MARKKSTKPAMTEKELEFLKSWFYMDGIYRMNHDYAEKAWNDDDQMFNDSNTGFRQRVIILGERTERTLAALS